jgi:5'-3' exonuclease
MYKFVGDDALVEGMFSMLSMFRRHGVAPVFVFDGRPDNRKAGVLQRRAADKNAAKEKYAALTAPQTNVIRRSYSQIVSTGSSPSDTRFDLGAAMTALKKQSICLQPGHIEATKQVLTMFNASYIEAVGEADEWCAALAIEHKVWGVLSEDMDYFVYGCPHVLRALDLDTQTVSHYDTESILNDLGMTQHELREICVLSGTDYTINPISIFHTIECFDEYKAIHRGSHGFFDTMIAKHGMDPTHMYSVIDMFVQSDTTEVQLDREINELCAPTIPTEPLASALRDAGIFFTR